MAIYIVYICFIINTVIIYTFVSLSIMFLFIPLTLNFTIPISCIFESVIPKTLILIRSCRIGRRRFSLSFNDFVMYVRCAPLSNKILHFSLFLLSKLMTFALPAKCFCKNSLKNW